MLCKLKGGEVVQSEIINVKDMMQLLGGASYSTACRVIRQVKHKSDRLGIRGIIHRLDWEEYLSTKKDSANDSTRALSN